MQCCTTEMSAVSAAHLHSLSIKHRLLAAQVAPHKQQLPIVCKSCIDGRLHV
jgi:hypothetical protein